ncbi:pentatricopeptide repeat-containing protein [Tanacetum coccineum]
MRGKVPLMMMAAVITVDKGDDGSAATFTEKNAHPEGDSKALNCENFKWNVDYDMVLQTGLLDFYAKVGDMSSAKRLYNEMPRKDIDLSIREKNSVNMEFYHDHLLFQHKNE